MNAVATRIVWKPEWPLRGTATSIEARAALCTPTAVFDNTSDNIIGTKAA